MQLRIVSITYMVTCGMVSCDPHVEPLMLGFTHLHKETHTREKGETEKTRL